MVFNTGAALLDAIVLAVVSHDAEGTYGYKITQDVRQAIDISESTLYPVLRRLQKDGCLRHTIWSTRGETAGITGLRTREQPSSICTGASGKFIHQRYRNCSRGVKEHEQKGIHGKAGEAPVEYFRE